MTAFLLDTNVVFETRKPRPAPAVTAWIAQHATADSFLSVLTIGELRRGCARLADRDPGRAGRLGRWIDALESQFADRLLDIDVPVVTAWAGLPAGRTLPVVDSLLVATAAAHGLTLVTRNTRDVSGLGVAVLDPWAGG